MYRGLATSALLAACLVLAGCTTTGEAGPSGPTDLAPYLDQEVAWEPCPDSDEFLPEFPANAECATARVPVDYLDGASGRGDFGISLIRIPAEGASAGSLLVNPGGPGASGVDHVAYSAEGLQSKMPGYDIVGFDPRGVSRSDGFDCRQSTGSRLDYIELDLTPEDPDEFDAVYETAAEYDQSCRDAYEHWGFLGTASVARDVYVLANALGDDAINYYGVSYGSVIGYEILRTYPDDVARMIIESPVDPAVEEVLADQLAAFNDTIEDLVELCATSPRYPDCGQGRSVEEVRDAFLAAGRDVENPGNQTLTDNDGPSESLVYFGMLTPLYLELDQRLTDLYVNAIERLINEQDAKLFEFWGYLYNSYDPNQDRFVATDDIQQVVLCLDEADQPGTTDIERERAEDLAEIESIRERAPLIYAVGFSDAYLDDDRAYEPCSYSTAAFEDAGIPDPLPEAAPVENPGDVAVLVLGVSGDTATPYAWAETIAGQLGVPLVTQDTSGHGVYVDRDSACTEGIVAEYLASGGLPAEPALC